MAAAIAFLIAIIGAESALVGVQSAPDRHGPHALIAHGADASVLIAIEHPHVSRGDIPLAPDTVAEAVLPRATMTLLVFTLVAFLIGVPVLWRHRVTATPRGPPRAGSHTLSGRDVLAHFCIARR
ncbi:putative copper homeostasis (lipo)protein LpqS [Mycobacterium sp. NPDC003323]